MGANLWHASRRIHLDAIGEHTMTMEETGPIGFYRLPQVLGLIPVSRSTWYAGVKSGRFPKPIRISRNIVAWRAGDIHRLIAQLEQETPAVAYLAARKGNARLR